MNQNFCIHSSVMGQLCCFQLLAITNKDPMNIVDHVLLWHGMFPRVIAGYSGRFISRFLRNLQIDFQRGCTSLQFHQQWRSVPLSPHPRQHVLSPEVLILAILIGVRWNLRVILIAFLWSLRTLNISLGVFQPFEIPLLWILYPIFWLSCLVFGG